MARRNGGAAQRTLTNDDYTDRELLANIRDATGADGWATTTDIGRECGFTGDGTKSGTPASKVAQRLVWMRRGELLESTGPDLTKPYAEPGDRDTRWRLTEVGQNLLKKGTLSKAVASSLDRMDAGTQILLMSQLSRRAYIEGDLGVAFAFRREWQHNQSKRKLVYRSATKR